MDTLFGQEEVLRRRLAKHGGQKEAGEEVDLSDGKGRLVKRIVQPGNGELVPVNCVAYVHYTGMFEDKKVFDSSVSRGRPFTFLLGKREVIPGWDVGVASMQKGEKCVLRCEPEFGYGAAGAGGVIPPNTPLLFEVELLDWRELPPQSGSRTLAYLALLVAAIVVYMLFRDDAAGLARKAMGQ